MSKRGVLPMLVYFQRVLMTAALVALPQFALAATVTVKSGQVYIDRGQGYTQIAQSTDAKVGDAVMTMVGGSGQIVYNDGCVQSVEVGSVVVVSETSPCLINNPTGPDYTLIVGGVAVAAGVGVAIGLAAGDDKPASP